MEDVVLIPAYKPDETLLTLVDELVENGLKVLVVNDGSGRPYDVIFNALAGKAVVVANKTNKGKGAALKNGMSSIRSLFPDCGWFITADADGQHKVTDILRVRDELHLGSEFVLTVRNLSGDIPFRSRVGNNLSRYIYTTLTGHYFTDNQSGLRGFSVNNIDWLLEVGGEKYDYEMNMLYYADKQGISITTLPIETVYIDGNSSSHFDPIRDTLRIYKRLFATAWVTFAEAYICEVMLFNISLLLGYKDIHITVPSIGIALAFFNIIMNKFIVFRRVKYADAIRTLMYTIFRYIAYTVGCIMIKYAVDIPLFFAFNIAAIVCIPLEFLMHKFTYLSRYKDVNKERRQPPPSE